MDKSMPNYKEMYEKQEEQIAELKCVCEVQEKKLCYYERKTNKLKKKNKKLKKQIEETKKSCYELIKLALNNSYKGIIGDSVFEVNKKRFIK